MYDPGLPKGRPGKGGTSSGGSSGVADVPGSSGPAGGSPNFRCEVGGPAPLTPLLQAQDNHPKQVPRQRAGGLGEVLCGRVWLPGDMPPCGKKIKK